MSIAEVGTLGTAGEGASSDDSLVLTLAADLEAGNAGVLVIVSDNAGASGNTDHHPTTTDSDGNTYTKGYEQTFSPGSVAADGLTLSIWLTRPGSTLAAGSTVTMTQSANTAEKTASFHEFTAGAELEVVPGSVQVSGENGTHPPSLAISGLDNVEHLYVRGVGKEINSTTALTPTSGYTAGTGQRSRNNSAAVLVRFEFKIETSTGSTSAPSMNVISDTVSIFFALREVAGGGAQTITASGIATAEAFGSQQANLHLAASAIASTEAFGTTLLNLHLAATGIATADAFGDTTLTPGPVTITADGIAGAEAFGTATVTAGVTFLSPEGIPSVEAFGDATVQPGAVTITAQGVASAEAFENPVVQPGAVSVSPSGIASLEAFGSSRLDFTLTPAGVATAEAFGTAALAFNLLLQAIASAEAFGTAEITGGAQATGTVHLHLHPRSRALTLAPRSSALTLHPRSHALTLEDR